MTGTTGITVALARYTPYRTCAPDAAYVAFDGENAATPVTTKSMATRAGSGAAKVIGRVGSLAVALGIGTAVASTPWVAVAEPSASGASGSSSSSSSSSSESSSSSGSSGSSSESSGSSSTWSGEAGSSVSGPASSSGSTPRVVVRSSGGAHTAGTSESDTADTAAGEEMTSTGKQPDDQSPTAPDETEPANGGAEDVAEDAEPETVVAEPETVVVEPVEWQPTDAEAADESDEPTTAPEPTPDDNWFAGVPIAESVKVAKQVSDSDHAAGLPPAASPTSTTVSATLVTNSEAAVHDSEVLPGTAPVAVSAGAPSVPVVQDVSADTDAPAIPASPASVEPDVVSTLLTWVGLGGPSANGTGPAAPAPSPALVLASAFARRELQQTVQAQAPTIATAAAQTTSQTQPGPIAALLGWAATQIQQTVFNLVSTLGYALAPERGRGEQCGVCRDLSVPVALSPGAPTDQTIAATLCSPDGATTVQILLHGSTYDRHYWDFPHQGSRYSFVDSAHRAGFATLNFDRLGYGSSSHPESSAVGIDNGAYAVSQLVAKLRNGEIGEFEKVVGVGHSMGTIVLLKAVAVYNRDNNRDNDVDAVIATGMSTANGPAGLELLQLLIPAVEDPKFADSGLDSGYTTTKGGANDNGEPNRSIFYFTKNTDRAVIAKDEELKSTGIVTEGIDLQAWKNTPAEQNFTRDITVPVLFVLGAEDDLSCNADAGADCSDPRAMTSYQQPYFVNAASFDVITFPRVGHNLNLHRNAPAIFARIQSYVRSLDLPEIVEASS